VASTKPTYIADERKKAKANANANVKAEAKVKARKNERFVCVE
jgi:hypothetical protein